MQRLDESAEKAKLELSTTQETEINIPFIASNDSGAQHLLLKMNRSKLEELSKEYIDRSIEITKQVLEQASFKPADIEEIVLVGGQTRMPLIQNFVKELFGKEPNKTINPDEVVALGAAIQGGIMQGDVKDVLLLDVIPLSLGIETMGGVATKLIERNTTIPTSKEQVFSTAADNQTSVEIHVSQGERAMASDNKSLGRFILDGIAPAPRGMPQVEVSFDVDANGILNVTAKDKATGKSQSIKIEASSGLSDSDIEKMQKDAEAHAEEDEKAKELVEVRNVAEQTIYTAEKALTDHKDKIPEDVQVAINSSIEKLKKANETGDTDGIKSSTEELSTEMQKIGQYMQEQAQEGAQPQSEGETSEDNVRNVEEEDNQENEKKDEKE